MKPAVLALAVVVVPLVAGQAPVNLPQVTVYSPRVANQSATATFAMPVTALRYEPAVDIHARNLAEGQADITVRGGIFENTGFQIGAVTLLDPQTGHYLAELPIAPALLTAPSVQTGAELALGAANVTTGAVVHGWRPIRSGGAASVAVGDFDLRRAELHQGFVVPAGRGSARYGMDVALAHSESDGSRPFGEHEFGRFNARLQRATPEAQTDLVAAYQGKRFGWPNLYTPFNSHETENLQTVLLALNHRVDFAADEFFEAGVYHRRNKDDYAFDRFAPVGPRHPFQHTTWVMGAAATLRREFRALALNARAEVASDKLESTALTFGRYRTRDVLKLAVVPEASWVAVDGGRLRVRAGASFDDSNRDSGAVSPILEVAREFRLGVLRRAHASYTKTSQLPTYTALDSSPTSGLFRGNPDLGRSRSHNLELGAAAALAGWTAQGAVFWRRDDALVDWTFRRGVVARTANAVDVAVGGVEVVARRSWHFADLVVGYTALAKDADYRGAAVDASFYALNYARHRLTAAVTVRLGRAWEVRIDNVARVQADNALRAVGGDEALTTSAALAYRPEALPGFEAVVQVDNAWDSNFQDVPAVPAARRQAALGVSYAW